MPSSNTIPLPLSLSTYAELDTDDPISLVPIPASFSEALRDAVIPYLGTEKLNENLAAEIAGLRPRTLHRRLAQQHTRYSRVIDQARLKKDVAFKYSSYSASSKKRL